METQKTDIKETDIQTIPEHQAAQEYRTIPDQNTAPETDSEQETDILQFVPDVHYELIPIKNLVSNQEYQRNLSARHVKRAAEQF